jgi:hypothetical protein
MEMEDAKMVPEAAEEEFNRFAREWDLDLNVPDMSDEDRKSFEDQKRRLLRQIEAGRLVVDTAGVLVYTLQQPRGEVKEIPFRIPSGSAYMAMDRGKDGQSIRKLNAFLGEMTGLGPTIFANMDGRDVKVCQAVVSLFLVL